MTTSIMLKMLMPIASQALLRNELGVGLLHAFLSAPTARPTPMGQQMSQAKQAQHQEEDTAEEHGEPNTDGGCAEGDERDPD